MLSGREAASAKRCSVVSFRLFGWTNVLRLSENVRVLELPLEISSNFRLARLSVYKCNSN